MIVRYSSTAPGGRFAGVDIDDDHTAAGWQTAGHRVGRFRRTLTDREVATLDRALSAARDAPAEPPAGARRPGAVVERITADGLDLAVVGEAPAGIARLVDLLRALLEDVTESPVAAVELIVDRELTGCTLRHVGDDPLTARMATLTVTSTVYDGDGAVVDSAHRSVDASAAGERLDPGWSLELGHDPGITIPEPPGVLAVAVGGAELDVLGDGVLRPVELGWMSE